MYLEKNEESMEIMKTFKNDVFIKILKIEKS
jgi:hypothetical protein